jgi:hypothetical protein
VDVLRANREAVAWILLWAWIALTLFIFAYNRPIGWKWYAINVVLIVAFAYLKFVMK